MNAVKFHQMGRSLWTVLAFYVVFQTGLGIWLSRQGSIPPAALAGMVGGGFLILFIGFAFRKLTLEISDSQVRWSFVWGWPGKAIPRSEITSVRHVPIRWFNGWGIHYTEYGWLYNAAIGDALELTLRNGKKYAVGIDNAEDALSLLSPRLA